MAAYERTSMAGLIDQLQSAPESFDLFQALSLLERHEPERALLGTSVGLDETVRLLAQVSLGFVSSDVNAIGPSERVGPPLALKSAVMSLAGATGPLPLPFSEWLMERHRQRDRAGLEFLDIFNQRALAFLYRSRRKHRLGLFPRDVLESPLFRSLDRLTGLGLQEGVRGPQGARPWLRHASLQGAAPRSMTSLLTLLSDRLGVRLSGRQFVGGWFSVAPGDRARLITRAKLAGRSQLGQNSTLGANVWDQSAGLELQTPDLGATALEDFLPGGGNYKLLGWLARDHLQSQVNIQLRLQPQEVDLPLRSLGSDGPRLGHTSWLLSCLPSPIGSQAFSPGVQVGQPLVQVVVAMPTPEI